MNEREARMYVYNAIKILKILLLKNLFNKKSQLMSRNYIYRQENLLKILMIEY